MTKPLLAILLLLPLSVSAGELDGKAIYCKWLGLGLSVPFLHATGDLAFEFRDGRPLMYRIDVEDTHAVVDSNPYMNIDDYEVHPSIIRWRQLGQDFEAVTIELHRATLLLSYRGNGDDEESSWQCEVYAQQDAFQQLMEAKRLQRQSEIDEAMKDNKI